MAEIAPLNIPPLYGVILFRVPFQARARNCNLIVYTAVVNKIVYASLRRISSCITR